MIDFKSVLNGKCSGDVALVIGNGFSVNFFPNSIYSKFFTVGVNRIFYKYHPDIWIRSDIGRYDCEEFWNIKSDTRITTRKRFSEKIATHIVDFTTFKTISNPPEGHLYSCGSCIFMAISTAVLSGAKIILLIGCDGDAMHYPRYFFSETHPDDEAIKTINNNPNKIEHHLISINKGWTKTLSIAENEGIQILNCSPISTYDMLPKANLLDFIQQM